MRTKTVYECEYCGRTSENKIHIENCEWDHRDTDKWIETQSNWGQEFIKEVGIGVYKEALALLEESTNQVEIFETDELGDLDWAVVPTENTEFWLNNFKTKKEAENFCKEMGWKYD